MSSIRETISQLLRPEEIRGELNLIHEASEEFQPEFMMTNSFDEMIDEMARFYSHIQERWFRCPGCRNLDRARGSVKAILHLRLGEKSHPNIERMRAMRLASSGEKGGMAYLLGLVEDHLIKSALDQYVKTRIFPLLNGLNAHEICFLADSLTSDFGVLPGNRKESSAGLALQIRSIIMKYAQAAFPGDSEKVF